MSVPETGLVTFILFRQECSKQNAYSNGQKNLAKKQEKITLVDPRDAISITYVGAREINLHTRLKQSTLKNGEEVPERF